jgi:hypothetical protein
MISVLVLTGCASWRSPVLVEELNPENPSVMFTDATRRAILVFPSINGGHPRVCAEPMPGVALEFANNILAQGQARGVAEGTVESKSTTEVLNLDPGKLRAVTIFQIGLYRACETMLNQDLKAEQIKGVFENILRVTDKLSEIELEAEKTKNYQTLLELARELNKDPKTRELFEKLYPQVEKLLPQVK